MADCTCEPYWQDAGGGYTELLAEPDPDCPEHFPKAPTGWRLALVQQVVMPAVPILRDAWARAIRHERDAAAAYYVANCRPAPWSRHRKQLIDNGGKPKNVKNLHNQECAQ